MLNCLYNFVSIAIAFILLNLFSFSFMSSPILDSETVKKNINARFGALYHKIESSVAKLFVCLVCDEFLKSKEVKILTLKKLANAQSILTPGVWNKASPELSACYTFEGDFEEDTENFYWMKEMLLSPRSSYLKFTDHCTKDGFCICWKCQYSLKCNEMPQFAIANNYCFGTPSSCLLENLWILLQLYWRPHEAAGR